MIKTHILISTLLICLFRLPLMAMLKINLSPLVNALPILVLSTYFLKSNNRVFTFPDELKKLKCFFFGLMILSILFFLVLLIKTLPLAYGNSLIELKEISSTTLFLIFPILTYLSMSQKQLELVIEKVFFWGLLIASIFTIAEFSLIRSGKINVYEVYKWLFNREASSVIRINTFMGQGAISGILPLAAGIYFQFKAVETRIKIPKIKFTTLSLLALATLFLYDSLTLVFAYICTSFFIFAFFIHMNFKKYWQKLLENKFLFFLSVIGFFVSYFVISFSFKHSGLGYRLHCYIENKEIYRVLKIYLPVIKGCSSSMFFRVNPVEINNNCRPGEFHGLLHFVKYGLFSQLGWFSFFISPFVFYIFKGGKRENKAYLFPLAAIFLTLVHYSGAEVWGNNYIYGILVILYLKSVEDNAIKIDSGNCFC